MRHRIFTLWNGRGGEDPAHDPWVSWALAGIDPGSDDPSYWFRFRRAVTQRAAAELARRRRGDLTVGDLVVSWSRTLVPATMIAAAGFLLLRSGSELEAPPGVEEILSEGLLGALEGDPVDPDPEVSFASESF